MPPNQFVQLFQQVKLVDLFLLLNTSSSQGKMTLIDLFLLLNTSSSQGKMQDSKSKHHPHIYEDIVNVLVYSMRCGWGGYMLN